jgi:hypothetical protein
MKRTLQRNRRVIVLRELGFSYSEIAYQASISYGAVAGILYRQRNPRTGKPGRPRLIKAAGTEREASV